MTAKKRILITMTLAMVLSTTSAWFHYQATGHISFSTLLHVETEMHPPVFQVFYDIGKGYRERDAKSFAIHSPSQWQTISFAIPSNTLYGLRIDMINGPGVAALEETSLLAGSGETLFKMSPSAPIEGNQIAAMRFSAGRLEISTTPGADDPYIHLPFSPPLQSPALRDPAKHLVFALKIFAILFISLEILFYFTSSHFIFPKK